MQQRRTNARLLCWFILASTMFTKTKAYNCKKDYDKVPQAFKEYASQWFSWGPHTKGKGRWAEGRSKGALADVHITTKPSTQGWVCHETQMCTLVEQIWNFPPPELCMGSKVPVGCFCYFKLFCIFSIKIQQLQQHGVLSQTNEKLFKLFQLFQDLLNLVACVGHTPFCFLRKILLSANMKKPLKICNGSIQRCA
jgi:hypothetical protein